MYIERSLITELIERINHFPVTCIIGPRQVGKTTLAKRLMNQIEKECIYLDLELPEDQNKLLEPQLYLEQHSEKCVILDEIQRIPQLFPVIRGLIDRHRVPGRFIILGSASPEFLKQSSETLAGRIVYKELTTFNFSEIAKDYDMTQHWFRGGFPDAMLSQNDDICRVWLRNFIQTYLERDLPLLGLTVNPVLMRRLWSMLAHFHGGIWNATNFAKAIGVSSPTINRYVEFLEAAFILNRLQPFFLNLKKRLVKSPKVYIRDSGLLHSLTGITNFETLQGNILLGASWEGYVIEQIKQIVPEEINLYYYRTHNGTESDVVLVRGNKALSCIEIKYTSTPKLSKGFQLSIDDLKTENNFIVIPQSETYRFSQKVIVCSLFELLTKHIKAFV